MGLAPGGLLPLGRRGNTYVAAMCGHVWLRLSSGAAKASENRHGYERVRDQISRANKLASSHRVRRWPLTASTCHSVARLESFGSKIAVLPAFKVYIFCVPVKVSMDALKSKPPLKE